MLSCILVSIFFFYLLIYFLSFVHRPKVYSKSSEVKAFASSLIFPMFLMPSGIMNSIIQLCRKVHIHKNVVKESIVIDVDSDAKILIDVYEPSQPIRKSKIDSAFNMKPHSQVMMLFCFLKFSSRIFFNLILGLLIRIGCKRFWGVFWCFKISILRSFRPFTPRAMKCMIITIRNRLNKNNENIKKLQNQTNKKHIKNLDKYEMNISTTCSNFIKDNVLLIHGLNGTSNSTYIKGMANTFLERNCRVFCFNARGALLPPTTNMFNHIGMTADVVKVVDYILSHYKGDLSLVGFSMGANWVGKFLGDHVDYSRIKMGVGVCCPFDFLSLNSYFKNGFFKRMLYYGMLQNYKRYLKRSLAFPLDFSDCKMIEDIDMKLLDEIYKCNSLEEHYRNSSCIKVLECINVPTLFLSAIDDPIIPKTIIPSFLANKNPNLSFVLVRGGHLGFFSNGEKTIAEIMVGRFYDIHSS